MVRRQVREVRGGEQHLPRGWGGWGGWGGPQLAEAGSRPVISSPPAPCCLSLTRLSKGVAEPQATLAFSEGSVSPLRKLASCLLGSPC